MLSRTWIRSQHAWQPWPRGLLPLPAHARACGDGPAPPARTPPCAYGDVGVTRSDKLPEEITTFEYVWIRILTLRVGWMSPRVGQIWPQIEKLFFSKSGMCRGGFLWPLFVAGPSHNVIAKSITSIVLISTQTVSAGIIWMSRTTQIRVAQGLLGLCETNHLETSYLSCVYSQGAISVHSIV